jgi:hypothetical protein
MAIFIVFAFIINDINDPKSISKDILNNKFFLYHISCSLSLQVISKPIKIKAVKGDHEAPSIVTKILDSIIAIK